MLCLLFVAACGKSPWNNPYSAEEVKQNIYYDSFSERPKHLDPVSSYSSNEYVFLGQIYEPPLQYHFLKRPYQLVPLTATEVPQPLYFDANGHPLDENAPLEEIKKVIYRVQIRPGIKFQPHPAFARMRQ